MEEKHRVEIQGLQPRPDTCKFLNDMGRKTLKDEERKIDHVNYQLPSTSIRIKSCSDFQHLLNGVQKRGHSSLNFSEMKLCVLGETGRTVLQIVKYFQEPIL